MSWKVKKPKRDGYDELVCRNSITPDPKDRAAYLPRPCSFASYVVVDLATPCVAERRDRASCARLILPSQQSTFQARPLQQRRAETTFFEHFKPRDAAQIVAARENAPSRDRFGTACPAAPYRISHPRRWGAARDRRRACPCDLYSRKPAPIVRKLSVGCL